MIGLMVFSLLGDMYENGALLSMSGGGSDLQASMVSACPGVLLLPHACGMIGANTG